MCVFFFSITVVMFQIIIKHSASKAMEFADVNNLSEMQLVLKCFEHIAVLLAFV